MCGRRGPGMDQITIKTPNPKGRLFLKIDLAADLAADALHTT